MGVFEHVHEYVLRYCCVDRYGRLMSVVLGNGKRTYEWYPKWTELVKLIKEAHRTEAMSGGVWEEFWASVLSAVTNTAVRFMQSEDERKREVGRAVWDAL